MRGSDKPTSFGKGREDAVDLGTPGRLADRIDAWLELRDKEKRVPTFSGLCLELGISMHVLKVLSGVEEDPNVMASTDPDRRAALSEVISEAVLKIQDRAEQAMFTANGWKGGEKIASVMGGILEPPKKVASKINVSMPEADAEVWGG